MKNSLIILTLLILTGCYTPAYTVTKQTAIPGGWKYTAASVGGVYVAVFDCQAYRIGDTVRVKGWKRIK